MDRGAVVWIDLGSPGSTGAQAGDRPAIVWVDDPQLDRLVVIPLTKQDASKYPQVVRIEPDSSNCLDLASYALTFHIQPVRRGNVRRTAGKLAGADVRDVAIALRALLGL